MESTPSPFMPFSNAASFLLGREGGSKGTVAGVQGPSSIPSGFLLACFLSFSFCPQPDAPVRSIVLAFPWLYLPFSAIVPDTLSYFSQSIPNLGVHSTCIRPSSANPEGKSLPGPESLGPVSNTDSTMMQH